MGALFGRAGRPPQSTSSNGTYALPRCVKGPSSNPISCSAFDFWLTTSGGETGEQAATTLAKTPFSSARKRSAASDEGLGETTSMTTIAINAPQTGRMTSEQRLVNFHPPLGRVFEWYDFYIYGTLAAFLAKYFFTSSIPANVAFIFTLLAFAAGFAVRP